MPGAAGSVPALVLDGWGDGGLVAGLSTARRNFRYGDRDEVPEVAAAYAELDAFASRFGGWVRIEQIHGAAVVRVRASDRSGATLARADGVVRRDGEGPGLLTVTVADCVPVFLAWDGGYGLLHAGWRGTAAGILETGIAAARAAPADLTVHLGPAIGGCCYEVGREVVDAVLPDSGVAGRDPGGGVRRTAAGRWMLNLRSVLARRAAAAGVSAGRLSVSSLCTACGGDLHSFRASGEPRARRLMLAFVGRPGA